MLPIPFLRFHRAAVLGLILLPLLVSGNDRDVFLREISQRKAEEISASVLPTHPGQEMCDAFIRKFRADSFKNRNDVARLLRIQADEELSQLGIDLSRPPFLCPADDFVSYEEILQNIRKEYEAKLGMMFMEAEKQVKDPDFLAGKIHALCQEQKNIQGIGNLGEYKNINREIPWNLCLREPARKLQELYDQVLATTRDEVLREFNLENKLADLERAARVKYKLYKKKQRVEVSYSSAGKISTTLKGPLMNVTPDRIQVGPKVILRIDLPEEIQALFYEDVNTKMVEQFVTENRVDLDQEVVALTNQRMEARLPSVLLENGYVPTLRFGSLSGNLYLKESWIPMKEYAPILQKHILQDLRTEIGKERIVKYMEKQGYFFSTQEMEWTCQEAKDYVLVAKPYLALVGKAKDATGWKLIRDEKAKLGYQLLSPYDSFRLECQRTAQYMLQNGYQKDAWLPDYDYWTAFITK
ncbi:MAG: hypothetical protein ACI4SG_04300 [Oligosphaeraceae bacterium]